MAPISYLISFIEEETEISEDHPQLLPAIAVLELSKQVSTELVFDCILYIFDTDTGVPMPADVHCRVGSIQKIVITVRSTARKTMICIVFYKLGNQYKKKVMISAARYVFCACKQSDFRLAQVDGL